MIKISPKHKEAILAVSTVKQYPNYVDFLKIQRNNCMVREFKNMSSDPVEVFGNKKYFQGQVDMINTIIKIAEELKIRED